MASTTYPSEMEKMWSKATMVLARDWVTSTANTCDVPRFGALLRRYHLYVLLSFLLLLDYKNSGYNGAPGAVFWVESGMATQPARGGRRRWRSSKCLCYLPPLTGSSNPPYKGSGLGFWCTKIL